MWNKGYVLEGKGKGSRRAVNYFLVIVGRTFSPSHSEMESPPISKIPELK